VANLFAECAMKSSLPLVVALTLALSACQRESTPEAPAAPPASSAQPAPPATDKQPAPIAEQAPADGLQQARFEGYGDLKLGSTGEATRAAWGGELNSSTPSEPGGCILLTPKWATDKADVAFMVEGDRFVRYDVTTDKEAAPGGGKVGMDEAALKALYPALSESPHKYVEGAKYLSVDAPAPATTKLIFETDAAGKVITWRVGLAPQVDYVESCS
jgi:hypothetical protein